MATNKKEEVHVITDAEPVANETVQEENVSISIEQICAAIINTYKTVVVPMENLLKDYSDKNIAVTQDEETKILTFTLGDNPVQEVSEESPVESE